MRSADRRRVVLLAVAVGVVLAPMAVAAGSAADPVFVETDITGETTWTSAEGPYRIVADVSVAPNASLTIEPGTEVQVAEGISLSVEGTLNATGSAAEPVLFTSPRTDPGPGTWDSIRAAGEGHATLSLEHVSLRYAMTGVAVANPDTSLSVSSVEMRDLSRDGIRVEQASGSTALSVADTTFRRIGGDGIEAVGADGEPVSRVAGWRIAGSTFDSLAGDGIDLHGTEMRSVEIRDNAFAAIGDTAVRTAGEHTRRVGIGQNEIAGATRGIVVASADLRDVEIAQNRIERGGTGVQVTTTTNVGSLAILDNRVAQSETGVRLIHEPVDDGFYSFAARIEGNTLSDNAVHGLELQTKIFSAETLSVRNNTLADNGWYGARFGVGELRNATIADNRLVGNGEGGLSVAARHVRETTIRDTLARSNQGPGIALEASQQVTQVEIHDTRILDNAGVGLLVSNGEASRGNYTVRDSLLAANAYGLVLDGPQTAVIERNEIVFNTYAVGEPVRRSGLAPGVGVVAANGSDSFRLVENDVYGNAVGLYTDTGGTVEADANYWGAASGPYHQSINPEGEGDVVVTDRGWADIIHAESERIGQAHERPVASLEVRPEEARPGETVTFSGGASTDADGTVETFAFTVQNRTVTSASPTWTERFPAPGSYPVRLVVEDDLGIDSPAASATVTVEAAPNSPTTTTTGTGTPGDGATTPGGDGTPPDGTETEDRGMLGALLSIGGLLGAIVYLFALGYGAIGMYQTVTEQPLTIDGRRVHGLAAGALLVWALASVIGPPALLSVSALGLGLWIGLTAVAFAVARWT